MGFFDKLKKITSNLFSGFTEADEDFFEELEETLIMADLGVDAATDAVEKLRTKVRKEHLQSQEAVREGLREILKKMGECGVTVLANDYRVLSRGGAEIVVAGVHDPCGPYDMKSPAELVSQIRGERGGDFLLMLSHRNDELPMWSELGVDLVLSGHCHGGVVRLPFVGGVFGTRRELFPDFDAGAYRQDGTVLYVSRGLGYTNVHFRLFNRPHVPILLLKSGKNVNKS